MKIAIQGHPTRGKEVIQILESLGGKNTEKLKGTHKTFYYIDNKNEIDNDLKENFPSTYNLYTLEEFEKEFPFKVGDKVTHPLYDKPFTIIELNPTSEFPYVLQNEEAEFNAKSKILTKYKKKKIVETRTINLSLNKAKEWYKKGGELREIALQAFIEKELNPLPRSWDEFCDIRSTITDNEYFITSDSCIDKVNDVIPNQYRLNTSDRNICPSRKSAEAHLAMIQLEQLRNCWWNGWKPEWDYSCKHVIRRDHNEICVINACHISSFLVFPTYEMAKEFLECFRDLIEQAGDLI